MPKHARPSEGANLEEGSPSKRAHVTSQHDEACNMDFEVDDPPMDTVDDDLFASGHGPMPQQRRLFLPTQHNIHDHFSVFNALLPRVDVLLEIVSYLPPRTILNLYSVSAPFHYIFNSHYGSFIVAATRHWAPDAEHVFPWQCYGSLCIPDPALRLPSWYRSHAAATNTSTFTPAPLPSIAAPHLSQAFHADRPVRMVPSLKWLFMVVYRTLVCREIVAYMTTSDFPVPPQPTMNVLRKTWLLLDLQSNAHRVALLRNEAYFSKYDLYHLLHFCVKLDMRYTDPVACVGGECTVRKFLLAEHTLTTLWDFLRGADGVNRLDLLRLWVKHGWDPTAAEGRHGAVPLRRGPCPETRDEQAAWSTAATATVVGVPLALCGRWGHELRGRGVEKLLRPDELVVRESVRRGLELQRHMWRMMRWGYLDGDLRESKKFVDAEIVPSEVLARKFAECRLDDGRRTRVDDEAFVNKARLDVD